MVNITNQVSDNEIQLYGYIGPWQEVDWKPFQSSFRTMDYPGNDVTIRVNCMGGDTFSGLSIFDLLKAAKATVTIINEGVAASMGGVLMQAASKGKRKATANSRLMIHRVSGGCSGESDDMREMADLIDQEETKIKAIFTESTGKPEKHVAKWFARGAQKWFTAETALAENLIDEILPAASSNAIDPLELDNKSDEEVWGIFNSYTQNKNSDMKLLKVAILAVLAKAGVAAPADADAEEKWVTALNDAMTALENKANTAVNSLKTINTARAKDLITNAKLQGKLAADLSPEKELELVNAATENYDLMNSMFGLVVVNKGGDDDEAGQASTAKGADLNSLLNKGKLPAGTQNGIPADRAAWDITKWAQEDPAGLQNLAKNNAKVYQALLDKEEQELISNGSKLSD